MNKPSYDHFIKSKNIQFAGLHLLLDMQGITSSNEEVVEILENCLKEINATILNKAIHDFEENNGISGCYTLAESHLAFHSWWEAGGVLILDIFTCGETNPLNALRIIKDNLKPTKTSIKIVPRGSLYRNKNKRIFYVYVLEDPRTNQPFYVGKGTKSRLRATMRSVRNTPKDLYLKEIYDAGYKPIQHLVTENTCEELSLLIETYLIDYYGREMDGGILKNICKIDKPASAEQITKTLKKFYQNMSIEEKAKRSMAIKAGLAKETPEARKARFEARSNNEEYIKSLKNGAKKADQSFRQKPNYIENIKTKKSKRYALQYEDGSIVEVDRIVDFCKKHDLNLSCVRDRINQRFKKPYRGIVKGWEIKKK